VVQQRSRYTAFKNKNGNGQPQLLFEEMKMTAGVAMAFPLPMSI
jgi:hypothetical protein